MGLNGYLASMYATNLAYQGAGRMQSINQHRMALANTVTGAESPAQIANLQSYDKALTLQGIQAQTQFLAAQAMQEGAQGLMKKNRELKQRLMAQGAIFV